MTTTDTSHARAFAAELTVRTWNEQHPVGTPVIAYPGARPEYWSDDVERLVTRTRSKAQVLSGHTAVVWVEGHGACIALTHVDVDPAATDLETARRHLPLDDPDRHALDLDADRRFAALAAQWGGAS